MFETKCFRGKMTKQETEIEDSHFAVFIDARLGFLAEELNAAPKIVSNVKVAPRLRAQKPGHQIGGKVFLSGFSLKLAGPFVCSSLKER